MILPTQVREVLSSNEISQIQLKDGTILRITDSNIPQYNIASQEVQQTSSMNSVEFEEKEGGHNHHKAGIGYFGHHFKTQYYNNLCADCMIGGGVVKKRKNYVLYVSKNCSENDVALKHKLRKSEKQQQQNNQVIQEQKQIKENIQEQIKENIEEQIKEQIAEEIKDHIEEQIKENIEEQIKENIEEGQKEQEQKQIPEQKEENQMVQKENEEQLKNNEAQPEEIVMEEYVECNDVPILEEKIILRKDENNKEENLCNECKNEKENINNIETNENICNECKEEINKEKKEQENNIENINNEVNIEENNMNNIQSNEEGEEMNQVEQQEGEEEMNEMEQQQKEGEEEMNEMEQQGEEMNNVEQQGEEMNEIEQQGEEMNNIEQQGEEMNNIEQQQNINEIGEEENICDDCMNQQQNEGNEEQKITKTVEVLIPENQNEN